MKMDEIIDVLRVSAEYASPKCEADYIGEDGLLYCGVCHKPKQLRLEIFDGVTIVPMLCEHEAERQNAESEAQRHRAKVADLYRLSDAPLSVKACTLDAWKADVSPGLKGKLTAYCEAIIAGDEMPGMVLWGNIGSGKTYAAAAMLNYLVEHEIRCKWRSFSQMMSLDYDILADLKSLGRAQVVFLDDFGAQRNTEFATERAFQIIDTLCSSKVVPIITTNITVKEMKAPGNLANERIYSRIAGRCVKVAVNGENQREAVARENAAKFQRLFDGRTE